MDLTDKISGSTRWLGNKLKGGMSRVNYGIAAASLAATMALGTFSACKNNYCENDWDCTSEQLCEENACYSMAGGSCETDMDCLEGLVCDINNCVSQLEIADNTRLPEDDPRFQSVEVGENELYFTFSVPAEQIGIQSGNVVVGSTSGGYLRNVESVELEGNSLRAFTTQASLTDAIENGSLRGVITFGQSNKSGDYATREQSLNLNFSGEVLYSQSTGTGQYLEVRISEGSLSFNPELDLEADISMFRINRFSAIASGVINLDVDVEASMGGRLEASREIAIGLPYVQPFAFSIGLVPVLGTATLQLYAGFSASSGMAGELTVGFDCNASLEFGAVYSDGDWTEIWDPGMNCDAHSPELGIEGSTSLEMYLRPELRIMVYGAAGPVLDVKPYLSWEGNFTSLSNWNWELAAGVSGNLGYRLEVFGRGINRTFELFDWRNVIASDSSGGSTCSDECSSAGRSCYNDSQLEICEDNDSDSCLERVIDNCSSNQHCSDGRCVDDSGTCTDDRYENNDSRGSAAAISAGDYNNLQICSGDEDWFSINVNSGQQLTAIINFVNSSGDLDFELQDNSGNSRDSSAGTSNSETVQYTPTSSGNLFVRVYGFSSAENDYTLEIAVGGGTTCTNECSPAGNYCSGSDVYSCTRGTDGCLDSGYVTNCDEGCSGGECNDVPTERFVNMGDGTVRDNDTGMIWERDNHSIDRTYAEAETYCQDLNLGGSSNWSLPSLDQSITTYDLSNGSGVCRGYPDVFEGPCYCHWTNSPFNDVLPSYKSSMCYGGGMDSEIEDYIETGIWWSGADTATDSTLLVRCIKN